MPDMNFFCTSNRPDQLWGPPSLQGTKYRGSFPGVKRPWRDVDHPLPPCAEVKNEWSYTSTPQICLNGVERDNLYLQVTYGPPGHAVLPIRSPYKIINHAFVYRCGHWRTIVVVFRLLERKTVPHIGNIL
jgi:hypothetical protein